MRKYYSSYTGNQIDEAVRAIVENQIQLEDLSPELIAEIKKWIAEGQNTGENVREVEFDLRERFPLIGDPKVLYVAMDQDRIYYWSGSTYREIKSGAQDEIIERIVKINSIDASIEALTSSLENKADKSLVNEIQALVGVRNSGDNRTIFEILYQQQEQITSNENSIQELEENLNNNYYKKEEVNALIPTSDGIRDIVNDIAKNDESFDDTIDSKIEQKLDNCVQFGEEKDIILEGGDA